MNLAAYDSNKDITVQKLGQNLQQVEKPEEEETFVGNTNFGLKRKNTNNMFMKEGAKRVDRMTNYKPSWNNNRSPPRSTGPNIQKKIALRPNMQVSKRKSRSPMKQQVGVNVPRKSPRNSKQGNQLVIKDARLASLFKEDDFFLPPEAVNCEVKRVIRERNGQRIRKVSKLFTLKNGTQELHEEVFVERI